MTMPIQKAFTNLMTECQQLNDNAVDFSSPDGIRMIFDPKEEIYRQLLMESGRRQDHLNDIVAILTHSHSSDGNNTQTSDFIKNSIDKVRTDLNNFISFLMPHQFVSLYFKKGLVLFEQERFEEAITYWEKVLKVEPHNQVVKTKLLDLIREKPSYIKSVHHLLDKYSIEFIKSFGHGFTGRPFNIAMCKSESILYVVAQESHKVVKFNIDGQFVGEFFHGLKHPCGIFHDEDKIIWICDFGNSRLLAVDSSDRIIDQIEIQNIVGKDFPSKHPLDGCVIKNTFYLILKNQYNQQSRIISFDRNEEKNSLKIFPYDVGKTPCTIRNVNGELFVAVADPPGIYVFDTVIKKFKRWSNVSMPASLRCFVKAGDFFYITAGEYLFKISENELVFATDIRELTGLKSSIHFSLAVCMQGDERLLILADVIQGCMHIFQI